MQYRDEIIRLHREGKSRIEISRILSCTKSTVTYHLSPGQKDKSRTRSRKHRANSHPIKIKLMRFIHQKYIPKKIRTPKITKAIYSKIRDFSKDRKTHTMLTQPEFTFEDVMNKIGDNPICYLTGQPIDLNQPKTYNLDHIIPVARGGDNSLDNLQICTRAANMAKSDLTLDEFKLLCLQVVNHLKAEDRGVEPQAISQ